MTADENANGFRLPTSMEWQMAARYIGSDQPTVEPLKDEAILMSEIYWTPGNYASGATAAYTNAEATQEAAWYWENSNVNGGNKTQDVGQKPKLGNGLGLYDMSGNVWEWCFTKCVNNRVVLGGSWGHNDEQLQVGYYNTNLPGEEKIRFGFRLVRTP